MTGLEQLWGEAFWLAAPAILAAGLVHGAFGVGFPLVATPLLAVFTDVRTAVLITLLPTVAVNITVLLRGWAAGETVGPHWRLLPFVLLGAVIGSGMLVWLDPRFFLLLLAGAILLYLNQHRFQAMDLAWVHTRTLLAYGIFGVVAGVMAGSVNVMLPVLIILALELGMQSRAMVHLFNLNFLFAKFTQILVFIWGGMVSFSGLANTLLLVPLAVAALLAGMWLRERISEERYRGILRGLLWVMAIVLLVRFIIV